MSKPQTLSKICVYVALKLKARVNPVVVALWRMVVVISMVVRVQGDQSQRASGQRKRYSSLYLS